MQVEGPLPSSTSDARSACSQQQFAVVTTFRCSLPSMLKPKSQTLRNSDIVGHQNILVLQSSIGVQHAMWAIRWPISWARPLRVSVEGARAVPAVLMGQRLLIGHSFHGVAPMHETRRWIVQEIEKFPQTSSPAAAEKVAGSMTSAQLTGVITGFAGNGWPSVRLSLEAAQLSPLQSRVVLVKPQLSDGALLMRGQKLQLEAVQDDNKTHWKAVAVLAEVVQKRKCIHPTRAAGLCMNCPRRRSSRSTRQR